MELVEIDENNQFPAIASGELDGSLEVWPSGHAAEINRYIEGRRGGPLRDGGIVDGGELGLIGNIGWWIPTYLVEERPELARWQGFKGNEDLVDGEFLGGDPTFVSYDEEIIKSLGLDLKVVYTRLGAGPDPMRSTRRSRRKRAAAHLLLHAALGAPEVRPHGGPAPRL